MAGQIAGKYAAYIWPAYILTAAVFGAMIAASLGFARRWRRRAEALGARGGDAAE